MTSLLHQFFSLLRSCDQSVQSQRLIRLGGDVVFGHDFIKIKEESDWVNPAFPEILNFS